MRQRLLALLLVAAAVPLAAQDPATTLPWRNIGPANMGGRVTDIEAAERNPAVVFVGAASGGVFKSVNGGTTWSPIFTEYGTANIGDLALFQPNPDIIWVGTGESCVRNSAGWGDGVYKSTDGGKTFTHVGLRETHHISEVLTHPANPDIAWVAAQGHLWGRTGERGIFKTTDGGRTWQRLTRGLPDDGRTGASDLVMDPSNPDILYAGMWERYREPHAFTSGGSNGGIFKSVDGGASWTKLTAGLPSGATGKIGLAIARSNPRVLVAMVEHGFQPPRVVDGKPNPEFGDLSKLGSGLYRSEDGGASWTYVNRFNDRPFYYSHLAIDPAEPKRVYVLTTNAMVSENGGKSFARMLQGIANDFHAIWINPANPDHFYIGNDKGAFSTLDRGQRFLYLDNMDLGQFYAVTLDNRDPYWVYGGLQDNGNWGGPSNSRDVNGILTDHWFKFHAGDGFHATVDPDDWRTVYTEAQGGMIRRLDAVNRQQGKSVTPTPATVTNFDSVMPGYTGPRQRLPRPAFRFNWSTPIILSPHDSRAIWYGGNRLFKSTDRGESWRIVSPDLTTNDSTVILEATGGLTREATGAEAHATMISIAESPVVPGLLWVGTDDGNVQLTRDGGATWTNVRPAITGVPARTWVSRVEASRFDPAVAYVTFDGHRRDDFRPYVYRTADYGRTWTSLTGTLPADEPAYVIEEDTRNPDLLYLGTERGVWVTVNAGQRWARMTGLPTVPVYDLVVHPREGDLVAATHGRSFWILDDTGPLQQWSAEVQGSALHLFDTRPATRWRGVSRGGERGHLLFAGRNPFAIGQSPPQNSPSELETFASIDVWLKERPAGKVRLEIGPMGGPARWSGEFDGVSGINRFRWNMRWTPTAATPRPEAPPGMAAETESAGPMRPRGEEAAAGTYWVRVTAGGRTRTGTVTLRSDPTIAGP